ncbi:Gfo/Idh/MocA family oxidoreductase [Mumia sp. zg.B21]|uniref:Gfo/Idh/MocA family oxidoreductase n=1 Tax=Mumia sp. zg.B21 TaxID=2855447 RepID=UPI001C6DF908|nr:Gfo/Idh/MocA family oxidoreductase [Mumia sp. zg.B21]MBW9211442.1 Gfo/Idh/MocA family oxidoreductase [Mumia sp. zg.B21]
MNGVRIGLIGAGRIGAAHAETLVRTVHGADLVAVADPRPGVAAALAQPLGARGETTAEAVTAADDIDAVVITASSTAHSALVVAAAEAGKHVFCEKPAGMTLAEIDAGVAAASAAGVVFQVGFNRRFARDFRAAHDAVVDGAIGQVRMLRSLTRDAGEGPPDPAAVPPWTIFTQTLIHDFDMLNWLNPGARAVDVLATADALVAPRLKSSGLLDSAVVVIRYDSGAIGTAEASFAAAYGYDVRAEVLGSAGMVTAGDAAASTMRLHDASGRRAATARSDVALLGDAYAAELAELVAAVQECRAPEVTGADARAALAIAEACIASIRSGGRAEVDPGVLA